MTHTVAIAGGAATGSAAAYFFQSAGVDRISVIEPDPTYAKAATPVATGGCGRLFALEENIRMPQYSIDFLKSLQDHVAVDGYAPDVHWGEQGYFFVGGAQHAQMLEDNFKVQQRLGVMSS
jgi:FAD-dependent oxidoreductase domain-containing protein 1